MYNMYWYNFVWKRLCCNFKIYVYGSGVGSKLEGNGGQIYSVLDIFNKFKKMVKWLLL